MVRATALDNEITQFVAARRVGGRDLYRAAGYLVDGLLVDTGIAHTDEAFLRCLDDLCVNRIVNTHSHEDHIGSNALLQLERQVPILAHPQALPILAQPRRLPLRPYQRFLFGYPRPSLGEPIGDKVSTDRYEFQILQTPGHSPDHVALFEEKRGWLFSGDAYIGGKERILREDYDIWGMIRTLKRLSALPLNTLFTGTGSIIRNPIRRINNKIEHLLEVGQRVWDLQHAGLSAEEISRRLFPGDRFMRYITSGHFASIHLVRSFLRQSP